MSATVLIALGSNRRHGRHGAPPEVLQAAMAALSAEGLTVTRRSQIRATAPLGPGGRAYANAVAAVTTAMSLPELLAVLQRIERDFGRRGGQRWGARVLDLDILAAGSEVLPSRLRWMRARRGLIVPHRGIDVRAFVLDPLAEIAPGWRHPVLQMTARQLRARRLRRTATRASP